MALTEIKTSGIADDAVTTDKLANAINTERTANTAKVSTTINNNADNRVITGSGTANTLEGETDLTYDGTNLSIPNGVIHTGDTNTAIRFPAADNISMESGGSEIFRVTPDAAHGSSHSIQLKSAHVVDGAAVTIGGTKGDSAGIARGMLNIRDSNAYDVTDNGGAIGFSAVFNSGGSHTTMSQIEGVKANNTDGNYEGAIDFYTRHHNGNMIKKARIGLNGLCFGSDTAAANALDDYEEGTFTPLMGGSNYGSYNITGTGKYTKVGRIVHFQLQFANGDLNNSASGDMRIRGWPFAWSTTSARPVIPVVMCHNVILPDKGNTDPSVYAIYGDSNGIEMYGLISHDGTDWDGWSITSWESSGLYLDINGSYMT